MEEKYFTQKRKTRLKIDKRRRFVVSLYIPDDFAQYIEEQKKLGKCHSRSQYIRDAIPALLENNKRFLKLFKEHKEEVENH